MDPRLHDHARTPAPRAPQVQLAARTYADLARETAVPRVTARGAGCRNAAEDERDAAGQQRDTPAAMGHAPELTSPPVRSGRANLRHATPSVSVEPRSYPSGR